jgi:hypothetical protein
VIEPDIIGREDELAELVGVLQRRKPAVVIVDGAVGVGRHALVNEACSRTAGWSPLPAAGGARLYVEPRTTAQGFSLRLRAALADAVGGEGTGGEPPQASGAADAGELAEWLAPCAPAVLVLERYRPERRVDRWFADGLHRALEQRDAAIVMALLDVPGERTRLTDAATARITLGPLSADAVRPAIEAVGTLAVPKVTPDELEVYVREIAARPGSFDSLVRLLAVNVEAEPAKTLSGTA